MVVFLLVVIIALLVIPRLVGGISFAIAFVTYKAVDGLKWLGCVLLTVALYGVAISVSLVAVYYFVALLNTALVYNYGMVALLVIVSFIGVYGFIRDLVDGY